MSIIIHKEEKDNLYKIVAQNQLQELSLRVLATKAKMNPNRARYVLDALIQEKRVEKILTRQYNKNYKRFMYKAL